MCSIVFTQFIGKSESEIWHSRWRFVNEYSGVFGCGF